MGSARYVGRVGALAVTLGIGIAMTSGWGAPLAAAEPSDASASSESASDSASSESPSDSTGPASPKPTSAKPADDDEQAEADDSQTRDSKPRRNANGATAVRERAAAAPAQDRSDSGAVQEISTIAAATPATSPATVETAPAEPVEEPSTPEEPTMAAGSISESVDALAAPVTSTDAPTAPAGHPSLWTLLAVARRELDQAFVAPKIDPAPVPAHTTSQPLTGLPVENGAAEEAPVTELAATALPPLDQARYTSGPSLVSQLVVLGLRVVDVVLKPFGGILSFTSLDIPIFTDGVPPFFLTHGLNVQRTDYEGTPVWTLRPTSASDKVIIGLHGGAYVAEASLFHWWTYTDMARDTGATVVVPLYPLLPEGSAAQVVPDTADFIAEMIALHGAENVSVIGDSAGGGLALAATQELVRRGSPVPSRMVLLAPWLDATVSDPRSVQVDGDDPLLDVKSLQRDGRAWAGDLGADHPWASPLHGSLAGLPETTVFSGSLDLLTPDSLRLAELTEAAGLDNFTFDFRKGQIHDWPIFAFLPDAIAVRPDIYRGLLGASLG